MTSITETSPTKFCPTCRNFLHPKEDKKRKILLYACRTCDYQEVADNPCVYRKEIHHSAAEPSPILEDAASEDPTPPRSRSVQCPQCGHGQALYFQANTGVEMTLTYVCCKPTCQHRWRD